MQKYLLFLGMLAQQQRFLHKELSKLKVLKTKKKKKANKIFNLINIVHTGKQ